MKIRSTPKRAGLRQHCLSSQSVRMEELGHSCTCLQREEVTGHSWEELLWRGPGQATLKPDCLASFQSGRDRFCTGLVLEAMLPETSLSFAGAGWWHAGWEAAGVNWELSLPCKNTDSLESIRTWKLLAGVGKGCGAREGGSFWSSPKPPLAPCQLLGMKGTKLLAVHLHVGVTSACSLSHCSLCPCKAQSKSTSLDLSLLIPSMGKWTIKAVLQLKVAMIPGNVSHHLKQQGV